MKSRTWATLSLICTSLVACLIEGNAAAAVSFNQEDLLVCPTVIGSFKDECVLPEAPVVTLDYSSDVTITYSFVCPEIILYSPFGLSPSPLGDSLQVLPRANTTATFKNVKNLYFTAQNPIIYQTKTGFEKSCSLKITGVSAVPSDSQIAEWQKEADYHVQSLKDGVDLLGLAIAYNSAVSLTKNDLNSYINTYWSQFTENFDVLVAEDPETMQGYSIEQFLFSDKKRVKTAEEMQEEGIYEIWLGIQAKYAILDDFFGIVNDMKAKVDAMQSIFKPYAMTAEEQETWERLSGTLVKYETESLSKRKGAAQEFLNLLKAQGQEVTQKYEQIMKQIESLINTNPQ